MSLSVRTLSDDQLFCATREAARNEKAATFSLLIHLSEVELRRSYAAVGFSSLFDFIHRGLAYSESQATERVMAVRLMRENPQAKNWLQSGELSLTNAAKIQRYLAVERRMSGVVPEKQRGQLISDCIGKSKREVEGLLLSRASIPVSLALRERVRRITPTQTEIRLVVSCDVEAKIERARELVGAGTVSELLGLALDALIEKKENRLGRVKSGEGPDSAREDEKASLPEMKPSRSETAEPSRASRFIPMRLRRELFLRSGGQCEWISPDTMERCRSRYRIEVDHIKAYSLGGKTAMANLRHLCRNHNQRAALESGLDINQRERKPNGRMEKPQTFLTGSSLGNRTGGSESV